ncbi:MAG: helix-turn-helix domain-containing protein [Pseudomonadota bacterium]
MKVKSFSGMTCSIAGALEWVGDRWTLLILRDMFIGLTQFEEFRTSLGISPTTLSSRLASLQEAGIIGRKRSESGQGRLDYQLTSKGRDLWKVMLCLAHWGDEYELSGEAKPPIVFVDEKTGDEVELRLGERADGSNILPKDIKIKEGASADEKHRWRLAEAERKVVEFPSGDALG